ncbi:hypothetical protein SAMN05192534_102152 [Alteribacillus persepolensis]|uniref:Uncharacterized protein n=1 Tax=Alteribacillus persepolensis TaxID=568899 RepID=A0A1G8AGW2_9BACI|nr:DUF6612 family protein [Alteribacillus persepolensis]SDH20093.1 hypothetical protein SAMN05192534_102152 [Alteribacillus persepolensis]
MSPIRKRFFGVMLVLLLTACMSEAETDDNNGITQEPKEQEPREEEPPLEETEETISASHALQQSIHAMQELENYTIDTNMNQDIQYNAHGYLENKYRSHTLVNVDPIRYHETSTIQTSEEKQDAASHETVILERYFTDQGYYIFDSNEGRWVKFPDEFTEDIQSYDDSYEKPAHILELIDAYTSDFHLVEGNRHYQLTFTGEDEQLHEIAVALMQMVNTDFSEMMEDMMYMTEIEHLAFELLIDKETFHARKLQMDMNMNMNSEDGRSYASHHTVVARYSDFNATEEVSTPEQVLEAAEEMDVEEFSGFNEMEELETMDRIELDEFYEKEQGEDTDNGVEIDLKEFLNSDDTEE